MAVTVPPSVCGIRVTLVAVAVQLGTGATTEATMPTVWPGLRFAEVKVGVNGSAESETNCGAVAKTVEELVVTVTMEVVAAALAAWPRPCIRAILNPPEEAESTGPVSRLTGGPTAVGCASWMRVARGTSGAQQAPARPQGTR